MRETASVPTPVGTLVVDTEGSEVTGVRFVAEGDAPSESGEASPALRRALDELKEYFSGSRTAFSVALRRPAATEFQQRVWDGLLRIRFGETRTYGELARELGTSPRAVGGACARNELPILIPCHRVVAKTGLGGFSGEWETGLALSVKARLLAHERAVMEKKERTSAA